MSGTLREQLRHLWKHDCAHWTWLAEGVQSLQNARYRSFEIDDSRIEVQNNPARFQSVSSAVTDGKPASRPCPLCHENLPDAQNAIAYGKNWLMLCNPAPLFEPHYTIIASEHKPQRIHLAIDTLLTLVRDLEGAFTVFYNGPTCGASIPEHLHIQAIPAGVLPFERELANGLCGERGRNGEAWIDWLTRSPVRLGVTRSGRRPAFVLVSDERERLAAMLGSVVSKLGELRPNDLEPGINLFASYAEERWLLWAFPRAAHRPQCFGQGADDFLISPGAIDLGGQLIVPRPADFDRLNEEIIQKIYHDVLLPAESFTQFRDVLRAQFNQK